MKINSPLHFTPRRASAPRQDPGQEQGGGLREENPWLARAIDIAHVTTEVTGLGGGAAQAGVALGATVWGVNKLVQGETWLDRVEGCSSLALAGEAAFLALGQPDSLLGQSLGALHGSGDVLIGAVDLRRGWREEEPQRLAAGAFQMLTGSGMLVGLAPGALMAGQAMMVIGLVGRQISLQACPPN